MELPHEGMINKLAHKFQNITYLDPAITIEDLKSIGREELLTIKEIPDNLQFSTILHRKITQRLLNLYKRASRYCQTFSNADFDQILTTTQDSTTKFEDRLFELPNYLREIAEALIESPHTLSKGKKGVTKSSLVTYLVKEKSWQRKKAIKTLSQLYNNI